MDELQLHTLLAVYCMRVYDCEMSCYAVSPLKESQCKLEQLQWGAPSNRNLAWAAASIAVKGLLYAIYHNRIFQVFVMVETMIMWKRTIYLFFDSSELIKNKDSFKSVNSKHL